MVRSFFSLPELLNEVTAALLADDLADSLGAYSDSSRDIGLT